MVPSGAITSPSAVWILVRSGRVWPQEPGAGSGGGRLGGAVWAAASAGERTRARHRRRDVMRFLPGELKRVASYAGHPLGTTVKTARPRSTNSDTKHGSDQN